MFRKNLYALVLISSIVNIPLNAMDMDKVNALAKQIKAANGTKSIQQNVATKATKIEPSKAQPIDATLPTQESTVATATPTNTVTEESLGLRKTNLYNEDSDTIGETTNYGKKAAGSSQKFERAFENAPPMIPHDVEGMLPIKMGNNACTGCHLPDVAASMNATPIPTSHFASFRPITTIGTNGEVIKEGQAVNNTSDVKMVVHKLGDLSNARFNCSQCHAPQSTQEPLVGNTFQPDFREENGSKRSNLIDVINEGVQ